MYKPSKLVFEDQLPTFEFEQTLLIYDARLAKVSKDFAGWLKKFPYKYGVKSGETLKALEKFPSHASRLIKIAEPLSPRTMTVVAAGGGSVGDFAGFFASVYKRGVRLIHLPSTWLSALDSAHGGKTALNAGGAKNQIGTFYPADVVYLVKSLLLAQPKERAIEAMGELGKIAVLDGGRWVAKLEQSSTRGGALIWEFLKPAIEAKLKVVDQDPEEKSGVRQVLNLGHTVGHVIESCLRVPHGTAVAQGLFFALEYSRYRQTLSEPEWTRADRLLREKLDLVPTHKRIQTKAFTKALLQDKKKSSRNEITFVFLEKVGTPLRQAIPPSEIVAEAQRQGWLRP